MSCERRSIMPNWVSLKDLMENPSKYGIEDPRLLEIAYTPDKQSITLTTRLTGYDEAQTFETETEGHKYYPVMFKGTTIYLVSNKVTEKELTLRGKTGYNSGSIALKEHANLWNNEQLGAKGRTWNGVTVKIFDILPEFQRKIIGSYWTTIQWTGRCNYGLQRIDERGANNYGLFLYYGGSVYNNPGYDTRSHTVRPLISLPSNIQVDIENLGETPLPIALP